MHLPFDQRNLKFNHFYSDNRMGMIKRILIDYGMLLGQEKRRQRLGSQISILLLVKLYFEKPVKSKPEKRKKSIPKLMKKNSVDVVK